MKPSIALQRHRKAIQQIVARHHARNPRVFGSVLLGEDTEGSDLDILVDPTEETSLFDTLQERILAVLEALNDLREDPRYELHALVTQQPDLLDDVAAKHAIAIEREISALSEEAAQLAQDIETLTGMKAVGDVET